MPHGQLLPVNAVLTGVIGVAATLLGSFSTYLFQSRTVERTEAFGAEILRQQTRNEREHLVVGRGRGKALHRIGKSGDEVLARFFFCCCRFRAHEAFPKDPPRGTGREVGCSAVSRGET